MCVRLRKCHLVSVNLTAVAFSLNVFDISFDIVYANHIFCKRLITLLLKMAAHTYLAFYFRVSRLSFALLIRSNLEDYSHQIQVI